MPIPQVPESLAQRVIDGTVVPWEVVPSIKVHELVKNHTEIPGSPTFYTATFILAMNKPKYDALAGRPQGGDRRQFREWRRPPWPARSGTSRRIVVSEMVKARGNTIITLTTRRSRAWHKATEPVIENWLKTDEGAWPRRRQAARRRPRRYQEARDAQPDPAGLAAPRRGPSFAMPPEHASLRHPLRENR